MSELKDINDILSSIYHNQISKEDLFEILFEINKPLNEKLDRISDLLDEIVYVLRNPPK